MSGPYRVAEHNPIAWKIEGPSGTVLQFIYFKHEATKACDAINAAYAAGRAGLDDEMERVATLMRSYDSVHLDLDAGKSWAEVSAEWGFTLNYENWRAYMQQRLIMGLRGILLPLLAPQADKDQT